MLHDNAVVDDAGHILCGEELECGNALLPSTFDCLILITLQ